MVFIREYCDEPGNSFNSISLRHQSVWLLYCGCYIFTYKAMGCPCTEIDNSTHGGQMKVNISVRSTGLGE